MKKNTSSQPLSAAKKKRTTRPKEQRLTMSNFVASRISLTEAQASIVAWRDKIKQDPSSLLENFHGFLISTEDILGLANVMINHMQERKVILGVRAYLGIELRDTEPYKPFAGQPALIFVAVEEDTGNRVGGPVKLFGRDIYNRNETGAGVNEGSEIFNFTRPCPVCCDPSSELLDIPAPKKRLALKSLGTGNKRKSAKSKKKQ